MTLLAIVAALVLLGVNAWFVAVEYALVAANRLELEAKLEAGDATARKARKALVALDDRPRQLAGSQLGITLASLALGVLIQPAMARLIEPVIERFGDPPERVEHAIAFVVALGVVAFLHMVLAEMVPKGLVLANPTGALITLAPGHAVFVSAFRPLIRLIDLAASAIMRMLRLRSSRELGTVRGPVEFTALIDASRDEGLLEEFEHTLLAGAIDFRRRVASSAVVPRDRVVYVNRRMTVGSVERLAHRSGHSRLPVVGTGLDNVIGFLHVKDLLRLPPESRDEPVPLELIRRMLVVPEDRPLEDVLRAMRRARSHLALVREAGGRTLGIVTLEDVLEELVGDIGDAADRARPGRGVAGATPRSAGPARLGETVPEVTDP